MQPQAAELLIQHLDLDIGFFDFAAPQLRDILAAQPQLQQLDLSVINRVYSDLGIPVPDAAFLSQMAPMMATADVSPLFTADGMRQAAYAALDGPQARPRTTGLMLMEVNPAVVVAGGGTFMVAGGALAGAGIGVATAATTALASAAAAVVVTGGAALFIFGAYMVLKGMGVL
jgi:hypothetical protein